MIIKNLDIENFGKFSGRKLEFKPGFNLIYGKNEDGKSTLMALIKMLFYSGSTGKSTDIAKNLRRKYAPWSGASMSGAVQFVADGQEFRLHKEFKKSAASDKTELMNLTSGEKLAVSPSGEMGEVFLDMELGEFERSVFIDSYGGFNSDASGDSLAMRIANLSVTGDEGYSHVTVLERIDAAREELVSKSGRKGLLVEAQARLDQLKAQMDELTAQTDAQFKLMENINSLNTEISELEADLESISAVQKVAAAKKDFKVFTALTEKFDQQQQKIQQLGTFLLPPNELEELIDQCNRLNTQISQSYALSEQSSDAVPDIVYNRLVETEREISRLEADYENLNTKIRHSREKLDLSAKKSSRLPQLLFLVAAIISGAAGFVVPGFLYTGFIGLALFAVLFVVFLLNAKKTESVRVQLARQEYETELRFLSFFNESMYQKSFDEFLVECDRIKIEKEREFEDTLKSFGCSSLDEMSHKTHSAQNSRYTSAVSSVNTLKTQFTELVSRAKPSSTYEEAIAVVQEITALLQDIKTILRDIETLSHTVVPGKLSPDFVRAQLDALTDFIRKNPINGDVLSKNPSIIKTELSEKRRLLGEYQSRISLPQFDEKDLESQITEVRETVDSLTRRYHALNLAARALDDASAQMSKGLGSHLSQKTGEYLSLMSGGRYNDVLVTRDLNVETRNTLSDGYHQWKYLSSGAIDRVYLALRLAATDIIAEKHNPLPLFLDDILAQYDDDNCRSTLRFLKKYLEESGSVSQILFFTCHNHITEAAKEIFPDLNTVTL